MKWIANSKDPTKMLDAIKQGLVMGRAKAEGLDTADTLESQGYFGFYDPNQIETQPMTVNGSIEVHIISGADILGIDTKTVAKSMREQLLNGIKQPTSDIDNRIKEVQKAKPKNYRARWMGTKYTYEPIDNGS